MYDAQMNYFIETIIENRAPTPGASEGFVNMRIIDAIYQSSLTDQVVRF